MERIVSSIEELVARARGGDEAAFARLYARYHDPVFRYLLARIGNRADAEDMTSEVFVEVVRRLRAFRGDAAGFTGWVFTIARHDVYDRARRQRRSLVTPMSDPPLPGTAATATDPSDLVADRLDGAAVAAALPELTVDQREVLLLKYAAGLCNAEVAEALGKPVGAVKSLQHRGLATLRRLLTERGVSRR